MQRFSLVLLLAGLAVAGLAAPAAQARPGQTLTFEAPRDLVSADATQRERALAELDSLGVRALRVIVYWNVVAPTPDSAQRPAGDATDPAYYAWGAYDAVLAAAQARGWPVLLTLSGPVPKWATQARRDNVTRPSPALFTQFATAAGRRYGAQVGTWSIWNEPNLPDFLRPQFAKGGQAVSPPLYRKLFQAGRAGLAAAGQGDDAVLLGETAPRGRTGRLAPLAFLRGTLCLNDAYRRRSGCGRLDADGYAHHAYTIARAGPSFVPADRDDVTIGALSRLTRALDRAARAGALPRGLPIHLTEFGIQSTPDRLFGVPLARQAEFLAASERVARDNRRVVSFSQYLLRDDPPTGRGRYGGFETGLRFADGRAKPSLAAFRLPLAVRDRGERVSIWGMVRPARAAVDAELQISDTGRAFRRLRTVRTDAEGAFTVSGADRAGRRWRLRWRDPAGRTFTGPPIRAYE